MMTQARRNLLDLTGLFCPEVVLAVAERVSTLAGGDRLEVLSTDPLSRIDIPVYVARQRHELIEMRGEGSSLRFVIEVRKPD